MIRTWLSFARRCSVLQESLDVKQVVHFSLFPSQVFLSWNQEVTFCQQTVNCNHRKLEAGSKPKIHEAWICFSFGRKHLLLSRLGETHQQGVGWIGVGQGQLWYWWHGQGLSSESCEVCVRESSLVLGGSEQGWGKTRFHFPLRHCCGKNESQLLVPVPRKKGVTINPFILFG